MIKRCRLWGGKKPNNSYFWLSVLVMLSIKFGFLKLKPSKDAAEETSLLGMPYNRIKVFNGVQKKDKIQPFADFVD